MSVSKPNLLPTLTAVAQRAGVSRFIAGHVLNNGKGNSRVSQDTAAAVVTAAKELGYQPNHAAMILRGMRSMTYGLLVDSAGDPLRSFLVQHIDAATMAVGCRLIIGNTVVGETSIDRHLDDFAVRRIDGLICAMHQLKDSELAGILKRWPETVFYRDDGDEDAAEGNFVAADLAAGPRLAVGHLAGNGRRRIALVLPSRPSPANVARRRGYTQGLADAGLAADPDLVDQGQVADRFFAWSLPQSEVLALVDAILDRLVVGQRADALVMQNDYWASLALGRLHARGVRVPHDVAVIGSLNHYLTPWTSPPLTSIDPHPAETARRMVALLEGLAGGLDVTGQRRSLVTPRLVIRQSSQMDAPAHIDHLENPHASRL